ncbi:hypothetical protein LTR85_012269 [Meristemomyces frigidus]|nr:hypothetical protein LTR85_012269 [Meristemomyces frigidus]
MQRCFCIPDLTTDEYTKVLSSVTGPPSLRFYAAAPIVTKLDMCIGVLFVVHDSARRDLSEEEMVFLQGTAKRCMEQLEMTREVEAQRRALLMSDGIDSFIQHREGVKTSLPEKTSSSQAMDNNTESTPGEAAQPRFLGGSTNIPRDSWQAHKESEGNPDRVSQCAQQSNKGHDSGTIHGETTYRKTFKRAAACLRASLEVDGVMFVNGFIGFHGGVQPVGEPELELEREMTQTAEAKRTEYTTTDSETPAEETRCFAWTSQVPPVFTDETVLCPYKAFLHSVMAEICRLDTVAAVKQQASFVSSVSLELRSPLHGILGAAELLAETDLDEFQKGLTDTITACGSTLQDTLSNVLSYAKINDFEQKRNRPEQNQPRDSPWALENKAQEAVRQDGPSAGLFLSTDIALLCEDIVQVLESGRSYNASSSDTAPTVTLDVGYHDSWIFMTEPGALRRIMMNIVGNAMKYSPEGVVVVSLDAWDAEKLESQDEAQPRWSDEEGTEKKIVVFTVKDTGKGMSRDFLENQLFLPSIKKTL